jgi:hypothetical protein
MSFTHNIVTTWNTGGSNSISGTQSITADAEDNRDVALPSGASEFSVDFDVVKADCKLLVLVCDKAAEIREVSGGSAAITLVANMPYIIIGSLADVFGDVATGVSELLVTSLADPASTSTLKIRMLKDSTP